MNAVIYQIASFMLVRNPVVWRASHVCHHTDTIVVGRDPEIVAMRPPDLLRVALNLFGIIDTLTLLRRMALHVTGRLHQDEATYVRKEDQKKVFFIARIWMACHLSSNRSQRTRYGIHCPRLTHRITPTLRSLASCFDRAFAASGTG